MKSQMTLAFNEITERFGLTGETVMDALEAAMVSAYRRSENASSAQLVEAKVDIESGDVEVFVEKEVVDGVQNPQTEVDLSDAKKVAPDTEYGEMVMVESTPDDFGRVAAQTAKQVILQRLREAERDAQYEEFADREGEMVHGTVHSITPQAATIGLGRAEAILPRNQQIPGEHFRVRDRVRVYVLEVRKSSRGPVIVVSRTHPNMLRRLLEMEVPEINQGLVEIKAISREAGKRAKVAVAAMRDGVDPVGACVGLRGVRIQSIVRDLNDEKIDVIEWNADPGVFIAKALSPARVSGVYMDDHPLRGKTAMVIVPEDQLSLAIGRAGVNARLSARLTGWRIDIKSLPEAAAESANLLQSEAAFADFAETESEAMELIEGILAKKAENRPVTPEEYQTLTGFVDRVQTEVHARLEVERKELQAIRDTIPAQAFDYPLEDTELSTRVANILIEAEFTNVGQVLETLAFNEQQILDLPGIGPKAADEIKDVLGNIEYEEIVEEVIEVEAAEAEADDVDAETTAEAAAEDGAVEEAIETAEGEAVEGRTVDQPSKLTGEAAAEVGEGEAEPVTVEDAFEAAAAELIGDEEKPVFVEEDDDDEDEAEKQRKKELGKVVEFDPESGETVVRRRRKRGRQDDDWDSNY